MSSAALDRRLRCVALAPRALPEENAALRSIHSGTAAASLPLPDWSISISLPALQPHNVVPAIGP